MQKRLYDIGWSDEKKCRGCVKRRRRGEAQRECEAMHEENFLSSWLREDVEGERVEMEKLNDEANQEKSGK